MLDQKSFESCKTESKNTVSTNDLARATQPVGITEENGELNNNKGDDRIYEQKQTTENSNKNCQYVIDRIIRQLDTAMETRNVVRLYEYTKKDDSSGPANNFLKHFCDAYWWRVHKQQSTLTSRCKCLRKNGL